MNLPASPTNGQIANVNGRSYQWNSTLSVWRAVGGGAGTVVGFTNSDTAPLGVVDGWLWWAPSSGVLAVRLESTWVELNSSGLPAGGIEFNGGVSTKAKIIAYASSITIDPTQSNVFQIGALTGALTLNISNGYDGQSINIRLVQDSTGSRVITLGSNIKATSAGTGAANEVLWLILTYTASATRWEGAYSLVPA